MGTDLHQKDTTAWRTFTADLRLALGVWRRFPLLPVISVSFCFLGTLTSLSSPSAVALIAMIGLVVGVGWFGTERVWYMRAFRSEGLSPYEAFRYTFRLFPRFLILGFYFALIFWVAQLVVFQSLRFEEIRSLGFFFLAAMIFFTFLIDVLLTFVTPALVFHTNQASQAISFGIRMLGKHWEHAKFYAIVPPLAVLAVTYAVAPRMPTALALAFSMAATLLNLWFKGATAAYFLRHYEVTEKAHLDL